MPERNEQTHTSYIMQWHERIFKVINLAIPTTIVRMWLFRSDGTSGQLHKGHHRFADSWVLAHTAAGIILLFAMPFCHYCITMVIAGYAIWHIADIIIYNVGVVFFYPGLAEDSHASIPERVLDTRRSLLMSFYVYIQLLAWFAILYVCFWNHFDTGESSRSLNNPMTAFYFSTVTMTTLGYGELHPKTHWGELLATVHTLCGIFFTLAIIGMFASLSGSGDAVTRRPRTESKAVNEKEG